MRYMIIAFVLGAGVVAASSAFLGGSSPAAGDPVLHGTTSGFDSTATIEARVAALEDALAVEREARQLLQEEVILLTDALYDEGTSLPAVAEPAETVVASSSESGEPRRSERRRRAPRTEEERRERLIEAGFSAAATEQILRREEELQMESLRARYDAQRNGEPFDPRQWGSAMRDELGDDSYERYLEATGRSTAITVSSVYQSSPAQAAGMRPGDQIVRYDGQRVFSMNEVSDLTMEGIAGEMIVVDILRDGVPMQVSMPRGPLGVMGGRRYRR